VKPDPHNIAIVAGDTFRFRATWEDSKGVPVPLVGYTAKAQVRETASSKALLTFSTDDGSIVLGEEGEIELVAMPSMTRGILAATSKEGVWALKLTNAADEPKTLIRGRAYFFPEEVR
jgi:hypothetical protein